MNISALPSKIQMLMTRRKSPGKSKFLQVATHVGSLIPLAILLFDFYTDNLTANPIQDVTLRTGKPALILLVLSLAVTPFYTIFKYRPVIPLRRPLGLYSFMYVSLHFLIFIWLDYGLSLPLIYEAIFLKPYALVGFTAFLLLLPMAITSTKGWQARLGKNWKRLHKGAYVVSFLAVTHYVWLVKSDYREPLVYGGIIALLLILRIPAVKKGISNTQSAIKKRRRQARKSEMA
jgi:sulfoxide reductase heme-binding subunit YedZ